MPRFSIILVHYQGCTSHQELCRGVDSLRKQTFQDFEIRAYHDGPLLDTSLPMPVEMRCMDRNYKDWGHTLRDRGIREASGDYILHFNSDNILYPNALEEISKCIDRPSYIFNSQTRQPMDKNDIVVFGILGHGMMRFGEIPLRFREHPEITLILTGNPPKLWYVDAMQFVMKRSLWLDEGGWYDKTYEADGKMYQKFAAKYGYRSVEKILGEHF
jgi:hypothetical protein